ncbi:MAG: 4-hydroxy-tetrahydrodipicolinate reductase [Bacteroidales bacterium]
MQIAIIGYGRMGREIELAALERGHEVILKIDMDNPGDLDPAQLGKADVAIEFTTPETALENVKACFNAGVPVVCGTTGWAERVEEAKNLCAKNKHAFFYASNFSIGVNVMFKLNKLLAGIMNRFPSYNVKLSEVHHIHKKDAPSGTAISLAGDIIESIERKKSWQNEPSDKKDILGIVSERTGEVPGTHVVSYESASDILQISHQALNRSVFASGAVLAAEFLYGKTGNFKMEDMLGF